MISNFEFLETKMPGVFEIYPFIAEDDRGNFIKDYSKSIFIEHGLQYELQEVFYTTSFAGVVRAIHFQREKQQPKLIRCLKGRIFDVVVDLRKYSSSFGQWISFDLDDRNKREILVPAGCGHGYLVKEDAIVSYKCAERFFGEYDDGIIWNDMDLGIDWPTTLVNGNVILSEKDKNLQSFQVFRQKYGGF